MMTIDQLVKGLEEIAEAHGSRDLPVKMHLQVHKDVKEGWAIIDLLPQTGHMTEDGVNSNIALIAAHLDETEEFSD